MPRIEAITRTAEARIRPVLLTTITTMAGLAPMMFGLSLDFMNGGYSIDSPTALWWKQLATAVVFGLGIATVLTLVFTPSMLALRVWLGTYVGWLARALAALSMGRASRAARDWALEPRRAGSGRPNSSGTTERARRITLRGCRRPRLPPSDIKRVARARDSDGKAPCRGGSDSLPTDPPGCARPGSISSRLAFARARWPGVKRVPPLGIAAVLPGASRLRRARHHPTRPGRARQGGAWPRPPRRARRPRSASAPASSTARRACINALTAARRVLLSARDRSCARAFRWRRNSARPGFADSPCARVMQPLRTADAATGWHSGPLRPEGPHGCPASTIRHPPARRSGRHRRRSTGGARSSAPCAPAPRA